jgi:hypothetical protein
MSSCVKNYCGKTFLKNQEDLAVNIFKKLSKNNNNNKNKTLKNSLIKGIRKSMKKDRKAIIASCKKAYCNPECKGTLFEKGTSPPKELFNQDIFKKGPLKDMLKEMIVNQRKEIFGKKTDVLKDSYYEKLGPKTIKKLKSNGATSGCTLMVI